MRIQSSLSSREYLRHMKDQMGSFLAFGLERFTGRFLGPFFYVTHHCEKDHYRNFGGFEKNGAIGFVRSNDKGCQIRFFRLRGLFCPGQFLLMLLFCAAILAFAVVSTKQWDPRFWMIVPFFLGMLFLTAYLSNVTENGQDGEKSLNALLLDPSDPFSYSNHQSEI